MIKNILFILYFTGLSFTQDLPIPNWENINYAGDRQTYHQQASRPAACQQLTSGFNLFHCKFAGSGHA